MVGNVATFLPEGGLHWLLDDTQGGVELVARVGLVFVSERNTQGVYKLTTSASSGKGRIQNYGVFTHRLVYNSRRASLRHLFV